MREWVKSWIPSSLPASMLWKVLLCFTCATSTAYFVCFSWETVKICKTFIEAVLNSKTELCIGAMHITNVFYYLL